ncbi:MAG: hypothetical protein ABI877_06610 [Gemmatimonadaceae bacterium]
MMRTSLGVALVLILACGRSAPVPTPVPAEPPPSLPTVGDVSQWPTILRQAQQAAESGDYVAADRLLSTHGISHPNSPEGAEADFFRALFKADPANHSATLREQLSAFDAYLTAGAALPRYGEVLVLRRLLETSDSLRALVDVVRATQEARSRAKDDEIRRLSDVLERTTAELDRIKRRLAKP